MCLKVTGCDKTGRDIYRIRNKLFVHGRSLHHSLAVHMIPESLSEFFKIVSPITWKTNL